MPSWLYAESNTVRSSRYKEVEFIMVRGRSADRSKMSILALIEQPSL